MEPVLHLVPDQDALLSLVPDDEDITPLDAPADPPTIMQGPMTRARRQQLNLEVSSFLSDPFSYF